MSVDKTRAGQYQPKGRWIRSEKRLAIYLRDGFLCVYCGRNLRGCQPHQVQLDHLVSRSEWKTLGLTASPNQAENLVTACASCNASRGCRPWREFSPGGSQERIESLIHQPLNIELARALIADQAGSDEMEDLR